LTWRYRIYLPPGKLQPDSDWVLSNRIEDSTGESRISAGTFDITLKITEDPQPDGSSQWSLNIGDRYGTERQEISAEAAKRFRESYKWMLTPQENVLEPNPAFIGLLKSEDIAVWIRPDFSSPNVEIPVTESQWYDQF
jgi:hypothetical protein